MKKQIVTALAAGVTLSLATAAIADTTTAVGPAEPQFKMTEVTPTDQPATSDEQAPSPKTKNEENDEAQLPESSKPAAPSTEGKCGAGKCGAGKCGAQ